MANDYYKLSELIFERYNDTEYAIKILCRANIHNLFKIYGI